MFIGLSLAAALCGPPSLPLPDRPPARPDRVWQSRHVWVGCTDGRYRLWVWAEPRDARFVRVDVTGDRDEIITAIRRLPVELRADALWQLLYSTAIARPSTGRVEDQRRFWRTADLEPDFRIIPTWTWDMEGRPAVRSGAWRYDWTR